VDVVIPCLAVVVHTGLPSESIIDPSFDIVREGHLTIVLIHVAVAVVMFLRKDHAIRTLFHRVGLYVKSNYSLVAFESVVHLNLNL
jgi:hypothetical protein